jgi:hypothetical protein
MPSKKQRLKDIFGNAMMSHKTWHQFYRFLQRNFGKDCWGKQYFQKFGDKKIKIKPFDEVKMMGNMVGYEAMVKVERYCKRYLPEIQCIYCDDSYYSGSLLVLVPHKNHGITVIYIPQNSRITNQLFLYPSHHSDLVHTLERMKKKHLMGTKYQKQQWSRVEKRDALKTRNRK